MTKTKFIKVPVSERLPNASGHYWIVNIVGEMKSAWFTSSNNEGFVGSEYPIYWLEPVPDREDEMREMLELYKECFAEFIPLEKQDEATEFLSTANNGLAKDLSKREK